MFDVLNRIKELREIRHWSVYKLAQLSGIPQSTIATWYQKKLYPPVDKIEILCSTFEISLEEFFSSRAKTGLTQEQQDLIHQWALLTKKEKAAILTVIDSFLSPSD